MTLGAQIQSHCDRQYPSTNITINEAASMLNLLSPGPSPYPTLEHLESLFQGGGSSPFVSARTSLVSTLTLLRNTSYTYSFVQHLTHLLFCVTPHVTCLSSLTSTYQFVSQSACLATFPNFMKDVPALHILIYSDMKSL
jgi:hypothetical protein